MTRSRALLLLWAVVVVGLSGCATPESARVKPWQRAYLSDPKMDASRDPLATAMQEHVYFSREAASGGAGVGGAGCGCN